MNHAIGTIIRYNRIKQHISQKTLSEGICVPSYLSKIETGEILPSDDVCNHLMSKLGITFGDDSLRQEDYQKLNQISDLMTNLLEKDARSLFESLDVSFETSTYIFEYLALKYYFSKELLADIKNILMSVSTQLPDEKAFFVIMMVYLRNKTNSTLLDKAIKIYPCGYGYFMKGLSLYRTKSFHDAYQYFKESETYYLASGHLFGIIQSKRHQGIILSMAEDKRKALGVFKSLRRLLLDTNNKMHYPAIESCEYNINYLKYQLGEKHQLEEICVNLVEKSIFSNSIPFHVLYELNESHDKKTAEKYLLEGLKKFNDKNTSSYHLLKVDLIKLREVKYLKSEEYFAQLQILQKILEKENKYVINHFILSDMVDFLKANRRYKEALDITESTGKLQFY